MENRVKPWKSICCNELIYFSGDTHLGGTYLGRCLKCNEPTNHLTDDELRKQYKELRDVKNG